MRTWRDVERDHLLSYARINSRTDNANLIEFIIKEVGEFLSNNFSCRLGRIF
jgi:hypothetical protein